MIMISSKKIHFITKVAQELASQQTVEDIANLSRLTGQMYAAGTLAAEIAVKLFIRVMGMQIDSRGISPVDHLVDQAAQTYRENYAG